MQTGLEGKPWYLGLAIGVVISIAIFAGAYFYYFDSHRAEIKGMDGQIADLQTKIQEGLSAKADLPQFREEVRRLELELDKLLRILPARKDTPGLIRRVRALTEQADFNLRVFDPSENQADKEFYREWPIVINLDGGYHELALFFDRVSRFSRIINIENLAISARPSGRHTINAQFTAKTFVYKEEAPPPPPPPARPRPRGPQ